MFCYCHKIWAAILGWVGTRIDGMLDNQFSGQGHYKQICMIIIKDFILLQNYRIPLYGIKFGIFCSPFALRKKLNVYN